MYLFLIALPLAIAGGCYASANGYGAAAAIYLFAGGGALGVALGVLRAGPK